MTCCYCCCCLQVLQPPHGVVYVAAKSFYFGVGGSTASFTDLVKADGILECTQVGTYMLHCYNDKYSQHRVSYDATGQSQVVMHAWFDV